MWEKGLTTLDNKLEDYNMDGWSYYDLWELMPATPFYHDVHVKQMAALYKITNDELFNTFKKKWENGKFTNKIKQERARLILGKHGFKGMIQKSRERKRWLRGK